jgi:hypothetical protein
MNIDELKTWHPRLYAQIYGLGVRAERERAIGLSRKREAAELIANSISGRNGALIKKPSILLSPLR